MRLVWKCHNPVPHLHLEAGDVLIYQPGAVSPYVVVRAVTVDPGAVMGAEFAGHLEPVVSSPAPPCRVLTFPPAPPALERPPRLERRRGRGRAGG